VSGPGANPYLRRPSAPTSSAPRSDGLADLLERVLDKGIVIAGDIQISLLDIELLTIKVRLLVASADTAQQMGIDWWKHDPFLTSQDRELAQENQILRERLDQLETALGTKIAAGEPSPGDLVGETAEDRIRTRGQVLPTGALLDNLRSTSDEEEDGDTTEAVESDEVVLQPVGDDATLHVREDDDGTVRVTAAPDWNERTKVELQDELRERGLPVSGSKAELVERLEADER
jgi:hypothetical protein